MKVDVTERCKTHQQVYFPHNVVIHHRPICNAWQFVQWLLRFHGISGVTMATPSSSPWAMFLYDI